MLMKRLFLLLAVLVSAVCLSPAQTEFRKLSHDKGLEVAKAEGKLLFVDFYATWCGWCKRMDRDLFPQKNVGDFMNKQFVCIKLDAEKAEEGAPYMEKYGVKGFPTYVILDPKTGKVVYTLPGAVLDGNEFIQKMKTAIGK